MTPLLATAAHKTIKKVKMYAKNSINFSKRLTQTIAAADPESTSGGLTSVSIEVIERAVRACSCSHTVKD